MKLDKKMFHNFLKYFTYFPVSVLASETYEHQNLNIIIISYRKHLYLALFNQDIKYRAFD